MTTQSQIDANRRNAQKSTGPVTATGRNISRLNALKTGIHAKSTVIPGESAEELDQLIADYREQYRPATPEQRFLVDTMVNADWMLRRYRIIEARLWEFAFQDPESSGATESFLRHQRDFAFVHRKIAFLERSFYNALKELKASQATAQPLTDIQDDELLIAAASFRQPATDPAAPPAQVMSPPLQNPALRL